MFCQIKNKLVKSLTFYITKSQVLYLHYFIRKYVWKNDNEKSYDLHEYTHGFKDCPWFTWLFLLCNLFPWKLKCTTFDCKYLILIWVGTLISRVFFSTPPPSAILSVCYSKNLVGDCRSSFLYVIWKKCRLTWIQLTNISIQVDILLKNTPVCWQQVDSRVTYFLTAK